MRRLTDSLLFRLTVPCLLAVFALWVGYTAFWLHRYESEALDRFNENGYRAAALFSEAIADALWEYDRVTTQRILAGLEDWPGFLRAEVHDEGGAFAAHAMTGADLSLHTDLGDPVAAGTPPDADVVLFVAQIDHGQQGDIGRLVAAFDRRPLTQQMWEARRDALLVAVVGFVGIGVLLACVAGSVTRPLVRVTDAIERVAEGDLDLTVPNAQGAGEVGRLARALEVFRRDAVQLVNAKAEAAATRHVADLAMVDELTGLANRRAVSEHFNVIEADPDTQLVCTIIHVDLDGFKQINDTLGHKAGDHVIQTIADRLKSIDPRCTLIARVGGDEFVLILRHPPGATAPRDIAENAIHRTRAPIDYSGQMLMVGASAGYATRLARDEALADTLVHADVALYRAKSQGKGCAVAFSHEHRLELLARKKVSDEILHGINAARFVPFFQPIVDARTYHMVGVEMLARWDHPKEGILTPARFLSIATDLNLMRLIDRQVFGTAIDLFKHWRAEGLNVPRLSVNVSMTRLLEPDFFDMLASAHAADIAVDVELLESIYLDEPSSQLLWQLDRVREMGAGLHIDDFGTGHASVAGLLHIAPDKVKIDRQFVSPALEDERAQGLVRTILAICGQLEIDAVAEGVETIEHARLMHACGCQFLQGHAFARPLPAEDLNALMRSTPSGALVPSSMRAVGA